MSGEPQDAQRLPIPDIPMTPVESSNLAQSGYDQKTKTLRIMFKSGNGYDYYGVPVGTAMALSGAKSVGQFFNARIKNQFPSRQIAKRPPKPKAQAGGGK